MPSKGKHYKGKAKLYQETMTQYLKEGECFKCGEYGHVTHTCPKKKQKEDPGEDTYPGRYF